MEKILVIGFVVAVFGVILGLYIRRRGLSFEGTVVDKDIQETQVNNTNQDRSSGLSINLGSGNVKHSYKLKVQTDTGKTINWEVSEGKYQIANIGDRITKQPGTTEVEIIPKTPPTTPAPPPPPVTTITS